MIDRARIPDLGTCFVAYEGGVSMCSAVLVHLRPKTERLQSRRRRRQILFPDVKPRYI